MASSDIRDWLREQGEQVSDRGRLKAEQIEAYRAAHPDDDSAYPDDPPEPPGAAAGRGPGSDSAAPAGESRPTTQKRSRSARSRWLGGGGKAKTAGAPKARKRFPRVPVDRLIEHAWADMAWAANGLPPLERMLKAQAPMAGIILEDVVKDTALDKALQPAARMEDKLDKGYGLIAPNLYVLAVMATAPEPGIEPSVAHKAAWVGLRHSLLVMSRIGGPRLAEIETRAAEDAQRTADVESFIRFLFDIPEAPPDDDQRMADAAAGAASAMYASAGVPSDG